jgi:hypothetical protein
MTAVTFHGAGMTGIRKKEGKPDISVVQKMNGQHPIRSLFPSKIDISFGGQTYVRNAKNTGPFEKAFRGPEGVQCNIHVLPLFFFEARAKVFKPLGDSTAHITGTAITYLHDLHPDFNFPPFIGEFSNVAGGL